MVAPARWGLLFTVAFGVGVCILLILRLWRKCRSWNLDDPQLWSEASERIWLVAVAVGPPVGIAILARLVLQFLPAGSGVSIGAEMARVLLIAWSGWRFSAVGGGSLLGAAFAGPVVLFGDHVLFKGGYFLATRSPHDRLLGFSGVLISFLIFAPAAMFVAWLGGLASTAKAKRTHEAAGV